MSVITVLKIKFLNQLRALLEYKKNILFALIIQIFYFAMILVFLLVIYNQIPTILGWNIYDMIIYATIVDTSLMISDILWFRFNYEILDGSLNQYLVKPISEFVMYIKFNMVEGIFLLTDIILLSYLFIRFIHSTTLLHIIAGTFAFIITLPLLIIPLLILRSLAFYFGNVDSLIYAYGSIVDSFDRIPVTILNKFLFTLILIITPMGFLHWYVPVAIMLNKISWGLGGLLVLAGVVLEIILFFVFKYVYKKGLAKYEGFGG